MTPERLASLAEWAVSFDVETHLIQKGLLAPPLVCASVAQMTGEGDETQIGSEIYAGPRVPETDDGALAAFLAILRDKRRVFVGANIAFDMLVCAVEMARRGVDVMPEIFDAYEEGRVYDVLIAEALHAIAEGNLGMDPRSGGELRDPDSGETTNRYSLSICVDLVLDRQNAKVNDVWRKRYAELEGIPLAEWPVQARDYPQDDARNTLEVALGQTGALPKRSAHRWQFGDKVTTCTRCEAEYAPDMPGCRVMEKHRNLHQLADQCYTAWAMHLGAAWGFMVDPATVDRVVGAAIRKRAAVTDPLRKLGFLKPKRERNKETGLMEDRLGKDKATISRAVAVAYKTTGTCAACAGTAKVPSTKNPRTKINCQDCLATGLDVSTSTVLPRTKPSGKFPNGQIRTNADTLVESGDASLQMLAQYDEDAKTIQTYGPYLRSAHGRPLTLKPNVLLETDRTSYAGTIQQFPRAPGYFDEDDNWVPSLRECIRARPGFVLCSVDWNMGESITHAQSCIWIFGYSDLGDALLTGLDPHASLAAKVLNMSYEEFQKRKKERRCKDARQAAKPFTFGKPGGMGTPKLVAQQRDQGPDTPCPNGPIVIDRKTGERGYRGLRFCVLMDDAPRCGDEMVISWGRVGYETEIPPTCRQCLECADRLGEHWLGQWRENKPYRDFVSKLLRDGWELDNGITLKPGEVIQHVSNIVRGGVDRFTEASNGFFQSLLAVAAKLAFRRVQRECCDRTFIVPSDACAGGVVSKYAGQPSPLFGSRAICLQHDETLAELRRDRMHDAAARLSEIMERALQEVCPDMAPAVKAPPALMETWQKGAEPLYHHGQLEVWTPGHDPKSCEACLQDAN